MRQRQARGGRNGRWVLAALVGVTLAACAPQPAPMDAAAAKAAFDARQARLEGLARWRLHGRLGIKTPDDGGSVSLDWVQRGDAFELDMTAPLGQGQAKLEGDGQGVVLRTADGAARVAEDPAGLLDEVYGVRIPVGGLRYWILGIDEPAGRATIELDDRGRLRQLLSEGWQVTFEEYQTIPGLASAGAAPPVLPVRLTLVRPAQGLELRLIVHQWGRPRVAA